MHQPLDMDWSEPEDLPKAENYAARESYVSTAMNMLRWILSVSALAISIYAIAANLWITFGGLLKKREKFESLIPIVGGIIGTIGLFILPISHAGSFWWMPLTADLGCGPMLVAVLIDQLKKKLHW